MVQEQGIGTCDGLGKKVRNGQELTDPESYSALSQWDFWQVLNLPQVWERGNNSYLTGCQKNKIRKLT